MLDVESEEDASADLTVAEPSAGVGPALILTQPSPPEVGGAAPEIASGADPPRRVEHRADRERDSETVNVANRPVGNVDVEVSRPRPSGEVGNEVSVREHPDGPRFDRSDVDGREPRLVGKHAGLRLDDLRRSAANRDFHAPLSRELGAEPESAQDVVVNFHAVLKLAVASLREGAAVKASAFRPEFDRARQRLRACQRGEQTKGDTTADRSKHL